MICEICGNEIEDTPKYIPAEGAVCVECYEDTGRHLDEDAIDPDEVEENSVDSEEDYVEDEDDDDKEFWEGMKHEE